jgi:hypothetical protein
MSTRIALSDKMNINKRNKAYLSESLDASVQKVSHRVRLFSTHTSFHYNLVTIGERYWEKCCFLAW